MAKKLTEVFKCILVVLILILWVLSALVLVETSIVRQDLSQIVLVTEGTTIGDFYGGVFFPAIFPVLVTVSCFVFVIGCIGCCGAFTESQALLGWFFFSVLVSFCVELSAGIWRLLGYQLRYNESDIMQLKVNIERYGNMESNMWFQNAWKEIHTKFDCCGAESYRDWSNFKVSYIHSCCQGPSGPGKCLFHWKTIDGCGSLLLDYLANSSAMTLLVYLAAAIGVIQVVALILTLKLWLSFCLGSQSQRTSQHAKRPSSRSPHESPSMNKQIGYGIDDNFGEENGFHVVKHYPWQTMSAQNVLFADSHAPSMHSSLLGYSRGQKDIDAVGSNRPCRASSPETDFVEHAKISRSNRKKQNILQDWFELNQFKGRWGNRCTLMLEVENTCSPQRFEDAAFARRPPVAVCSDSLDQPETSRSAASAYNLSHGLKLESVATNPSTGSELDDPQRVSKQPLDDVETSESLNGSATLENDND